MKNLIFAIIETLTPVVGIVASEEIAYDVIEGDLTPDGIGYNVEDYLKDYVTESLALATAKETVRVAFAA